MKGKVTMKSKNFKSYCESLGKKEYNWSISLSKNCKLLNQADLKKVLLNGLSVVKGPLGNLASAIKRNPAGDPIDSVLQRMNDEFVKNLINMHDLTVTQHFAKANIFRKKSVALVKRMYKREGMLIKVEMNKNKINTRK